MKALLEKQIQDRQFREMMAEGGSNPAKTVEERVEHCKHLQYEMHQQLFAVGYSSIHKAAADNSLSGIKYFLALKGRKKIDKNAFDHHGKTALHHAAEKGHLDSIQFLIKTARMKVNVRSSCGNTALMLAVKENHVPAIELLMELKADITLENCSGYTCLHFAAESNRLQALRAIADKYSNWIDPPRQKRRGADTDSVAATEDNKEEDEEDGHDSSEEEVGKEESSEDEDDDFLLRSRKDFRDFSSSKGLSTQPSRVALGEASSFFRSPEGSMHGSSNSCQAAPQYVTAGGKVLNTVLAHHAHNGMTALHIACQQVSIETAEALVQYGADLSAVDNIQETPLHKVARRTSRVLYQSLVRRGADEHAINLFRQTPRDLLYDNVRF